MAKQAASKDTIIYEVNKTHVDIPIVGKSSLIVHKFSTKAQGEMLAKQLKVPWPKKVAKVPMDEYDLATHYIDEECNGIECTELLQLIVEGNVPGFLAGIQDYLTTVRAHQDPIFGLPSVAFKAAAIRGAKSLGLVMADMRGAFHIEGEFVPIDGTRSMRSDMVRISHSTSDIRFRPEFLHWRTTLPVTFNANAVSVDELLNMFHAGGFSCGVGEWRVERDGNHGTFAVEALEQ